MFIKLLFGSIATGGVVAGTVAAGFALTNQSGNDTNNQENTHLKPEVREKVEETNERGDELEHPQLEATSWLENPELKTTLKEKIEFQGKLVFNKKTEKPIGLDASRSLVVFYQGELFENDKYEQERKKWDIEDSSEEGEKDHEDHITIGLSSQKLKKDFKKYLEDLNKKIKESKEKSHLDKLEKTLEEEADKFKESFGNDVYGELLKEIQKLKTPTKK